MPELPEVETVRRGLSRHLVGRRIVSAEVGRERVVRRSSREELIAGLTDTSVVAANRRGKYLLCPLDSGDELMIHLRMTGQVLIAEPGAVQPLHTHVVLGLDDGREMWFVDPRTFGEMVVFDPDDVGSVVPELTRMGVDPIAEPFDVDVLRAAFGGSRRALKPLLLDQHVIAGIGNIYADEILHRARLLPNRAASTLTRQHMRTLYASIVGVLNEAIDAGGSTLSDKQYVDLLGQSGWYQDEHQVYGHGGERCRTCGRGWIRRTVSAGRTTCFCPVCQH